MVLTESEVIVHLVGCVMVLVECVDHIVIIHVDLVLDVQVLLNEFPEVFLLIKELVIDVFQEFFPEAVNLILHLNVLQFIIRSCSETSWS